MRTLKTTAILVALAASTPAATHAAPSPAGMRFQRTIYADQADIALRMPEGVACDDKGSLVIADTGNARLLTYSFKDGALDGGTQVKLVQLPHPVRVQIDRKGFVFALDRKARRIVKVDASGGFAGYFEPQGASTTPVTVTAFKLDPSDNVLVLDAAARKVLVASPEGRVTRELPLPKGTLGVTDVAGDSSRVYIVDAVSATVFAADAGASAFEPLSKSLKDVMGFPTYLTTDGRGKLYLVDQNGNAVVRLGMDGSYQGRELAMGWNEGAVYYPQQLCMNSAGDVFLADRNNHRIQIFAMPR